MKNRHSDKVQALRARVRETIEKGVQKGATAVVDPPNSDPRSSIQQVRDAVAAGGDALYAAARRVNLDGHVIKAMQLAYEKRLRTNQAMGVSMPWSGPSDSPSDYGVGPAWGIPNPPPPWTAGADAVFEAFCKGPLKLRRPSASIMHKAFAEAGFRWALWKDGKTDYVPAEVTTHSLLVEHDWAALLGDGANTAGEWRVPYDAQCFEMEFDNGWRICAFVGVEEGNTSMMLVARMPKGTLVGADADGAVVCLWVADHANYELLPDRARVISMPPGSRYDAASERLTDFVFRQVRATSIMLDAEVAEVEAIRAPYNPNSPPKECGKLPPLSHHVVRLSRRPRRYAPVPGERHTGRHVRLHFRRGHWRHYATWKTWIQWMLVGDPDLGFVEKEYRL